MQRWLVSLALALCVGACAPKVWAPRMVPGCSVSSGVAELDRERGYHAALLALHERKYAILGAQRPSQIEAEYRSDYEPEAFTRWSIAVRADGALEVRSVPEATRVTRKQETWFQRLGASLGKYQCRDLNWLRWEAQNHGLVPMGADVPSEQGAGGEAPASSVAPPAIGPDDTSHHTSAAASPAAKGVASDDALLGVVLELQRERRQIRLVGPIVMLSVGVGFFGVGSGTLAIYSAFNHQDADSDEACDDGACTESQRARALAIASGAFGLVFAGLVSTGATLLVRRLRRQRTIDRELRRLLTPGLAYEPGQRHWRLALGATF